MACFCRSWLPANGPRSKLGWKFVHQLEATLLIIPQSAASDSRLLNRYSNMQHSRQPARAVSAGVRARARKYNTASTGSSYSAINLDDPTSIAEVVSTEMPPVYEPSWRRTGRSSMAADVHIPSFLIPCSASQLMDARYKSRMLSRASTVDAKAISPAA